MIRAALLLLGASLCASAAMAGGKSAQAAVNCTPLGELRGDAERGATGMKHMEVPPRDQDIKDLIAWIRSFPGA